MTEWCWLAGKGYLLTVVGWCVFGEEVTNLVGRQDFETAVEKKKEDEEKEGK